MPLLTALYALTAAWAVAVVVGVAVLVVLAVPLVPVGERSLPVLPDRLAALLITACPLAAHTLCMTSISTRAATPGGACLACWLTAALAAARAFSSAVAGLSNGFQTVSAKCSTAALEALFA